MTNVTQAARKWAARFVIECNAGGLAAGHDKLYLSGEGDGSVLVRILARAIEQARAEAVEEGWQPIETAPRDGTRILAFIRWCWFDGKPGNALDVIAWDERAGLWFSPTPPNYIQGLDTASYPTHWRPLPAPPSAPLAGGEG